MPGAHRAHKLRKQRQALTLPRMHIPAAGAPGRGPGAGGYVFTFTGMEVQHTDHATFHGIGVVPDVAVTPSATQLRDGVDPELEAAVDILVNLP